MKQWQAAGKRLVLCLDANKNIYSEDLGRQLTNHQGLGKKEVVGEFMGRQLHSSEGVNQLTQSGRQATSKWHMCASCW